MYKEYRELSRVAAVESLYQDMSARHRARFRSIHILRVVEIEKTADIRRPYIKQLLVPGLKFPLPHRIQVRRLCCLSFERSSLTEFSSYRRPLQKSRGVFAANRPSTWA